MARRIVIEFLGKDKSLGSTADATGRKTTKLGDTLKSVGKVAALGLAAGAVIAGKALYGMTKNAMEDDAAQRKLATALRNSTGATDKQISSVEKWISAQGRSLGVTDDELRPAFQRLVEATGSVKEAQRQMGIAFDVSAGTGKSLETVSNALMKANNGTTASLSKLGLKTKDADGKTLSLDAALKTMSKTFAGQAAQKAGTLEGKMDRLKLVFDETKETIGSKMIPVLTEFADWFLEDGLPALDRFGKYLQRDVIPALKLVGEKLVATAKFLNEHRTAVEAVTVAFVALVVIMKVHSAVMAVAAAGGMLQYLKATKLVTAMTKAWAAVQWVLNAAMSANPIGVVIAVIVALVAIVVIAYKKSETFRGVVQQLGKALLSMGIFGLQAFRWLLTAAFKTFGGILSAAEKGLGWIPGLGSKIATAKDAFERFGNATIDKLKGVEDHLRGVKDGIGRIPSSKTFTLNMVTVKSTQDHNAVRLDGARAAGGPTRKGGTYLVGEHGPELWTDTVGGRIIDAGRTKAMMSGRSSSSSSSGDVVGHAVVDLRLDGRTVQRVLLKLKRTTGEGLGLA